MVKGLKRGKVKKRTTRTKKDTHTTRAHIDRKKQKTIIAVCLLIRAIETKTRSSAG